MKKICLLVAALLLNTYSPTVLFAQSAPAYALENVTIHHTDGSQTNSGTIIWRNGVIEEVGSDITIPFDAYTVIDGGDSLHVYPGFIDGFGTWGSPDLPQNYPMPDEPGNPSYERAGIQPDRSAAHFLDASGSTFSDVMKTGITTANVGLKGFMMAGQTDLFFLNGTETADFLYKESTGYQFTFDGAPVRGRSRAYPITTMGIMARFKQLMYDAEALQDHIQYFADANGTIQPPKRDRVLESLFPILNGDATLFANIDTPENVERLLDLKQEFNFDVVLVSGRSLHFLADELAEMEIPVLASTELPEKPKWLDDEDNSPSNDEERRYRDRQSSVYELSLRNIRTLMNAGVKVGFASTDLKADALLENLRRLQEEGDLSEQEILQIITSNTADILNSGNTLGNISPGYNASFSVFNSPFLEEDAGVEMVISNGEVHEF